MPKFIHLTEAEGNAFRGVTAAGHKLDPILNNGVYILPDRVLTDPAHATKKLDLHGYPVVGDDWNWYVDGDDGDDGDGGNSASVPFKTLSAAIVAAALGETIGVKGGSVVTESDVVTVAGRTVGLYNNKARWTLDTRQHLAASWSLVGGTSSTYEATVTHREAILANGIDENSFHAGLWLDDVALDWIAGGADIAANTAAVEASAGTFTVYKSGSTQQDPRLDTAGTIYVYRVHLPNGSDPTGQDVSVADRDIVLIANAGGQVSDLDFIGGCGKDAAGSNGSGSSPSLLRVRGLDVPMHQWVGSPGSFYHWGGTRRATPGIANGAAQQGNLINLFRGDATEGATDTILTLSDLVGGGWRRLVYGHTSGGQSQPIGRNLVVDGMGQTVDDVSQVLFTQVNAANRLFQAIEVRNLNITGARAGLHPGTYLAVRDFTWESVSLFTSNVVLFDFHGDGLLVEDSEWEFKNPVDVSKRNWLIQRAAATGAEPVATFRRCLDRAWNTDRRGYMSRGTGLNNFHLVVEDSTLGNLMDQAAGTNWPLSVVARNSTLGFGNRTQAQVEAALGALGISYSFTGCTFVNLNGSAA